MHFDALATLANVVEVKVSLSMNSTVQILINMKYIRALHNLSIAGKLFLSLGLVLAIAFIPSVISVTRIGDVNEMASKVTGSWLPRIELVLRLRGHITEFRQLELAHILADDPLEMTRIEDNLNATLELVNRDVGKYFSLIVDNKERKLAESCGMQWENYLNEHKKILALSRGGEKAKAKAAVNGASATHLAKVLEPVDVMVALNTGGVTKAGELASAVYMESQRIVLALLAMALAAGIALAYVVARAVSLPLKSAVKLAQRVAEGDLRDSLVANSHDETGQLVETLMHMNQKLIGVVAQIADGTRTIAQASRQVADGNRDLSSRTSEQAHSLEETAAAVEQLTATVSQNTNYAMQAREQVMLTTDMAGRGKNVVSEVVQIMEAIETSAKRVAEISSVIDSIAFQTNILALNAAVEAARAGEHGRGFAVVASEVRFLAQRSSEASREIKSLIADSIERVEQGSVFVEKVNLTMAEIVIGIKGLRDVMDQIVQAGAEQGAGLLKVNQATTRIDEFTQRNAALVEDATIAAASLKEQAEGLLEIVERFILPEHASIRTSGGAHHTTRNAAVSLPVIFEKNNIP